MQQNQIADQALTLHVTAGDDSALPVLRLVVGTPTIQSSDGSPVLTISLSLIWRRQQDTQLHDRPAQELTRQAPSFPTQDAKPFRLPSRFRNWYLCERDKAEWSLEVDDPIHKDSCPICGSEASAIAVVGLPLDTSEETQRESEYRLTLRRTLDALSWN